MHCKKRKTNIWPFLAGPLPIRPPANPNIVPLNGQVRKLYRKLFICSGRELITEPSDFPKPLLVEWTTLTTVWWGVRGKLGLGDKNIQNLRSDKRHKNCEIQIVSDFNVNNLNFAQHELTNTYLETMFFNNLLPVITRPTRIYHTSCELEILSQQDKTNLIQRISSSSAPYLIYGCKYLEEQSPSQIEPWSQTLGI